MKYLRTLLSAVLAGMCIGFGGVVFLALESKVLGGYCHLRAGCSGARALPLNAERRP